MGQRPRPAAAHGRGRVGHRPLHARPAGRPPQRPRRPSRRRIGRRAGSRAWDAAGSSRTGGAPGAWASPRPCTDRLTPPVPWSCRLQGPSAGCHANWAFMRSMNSPNARPGLQPRHASVSGRSHTHERVCCHGVFVVAEHDVGAQLAHQGVGTVTGPEDRVLDLVEAASGMGAHHRRVRSGVPPRSAVGWGSCATISQSVAGSLVVAHMQVVLCKVPDCLPGGRWGSPSRLPDSTVHCHSSSRPDKRDQAGGRTRASG
jgi:hypothetical protein